MRREELFSLIAEPAGDRAPGDRIDLSLTVPNLGGTIATGLSVRFLLPEHLRCEDGGEFIELDALAPGEARTVRLHARLAESIESGTVVPICAEIATPRGRIVGSNVVVIRVVSRPRLDRSHAAIRPVAGGYRATVSLINDGDACARDLTLVIPAPLGTTAHPERMFIDQLEVGECAERTCEIIPDERIDGDVVVLAGVRVACSALDPLVLAPAACPNDTQVVLADCRIACEPLASGRRSHATITATNAGPREARDVTLRIRVVPALTLDRRGVLVFGAPLTPPPSRRSRAAAPRRDERDACIPIGTLAPGSMLEVRLPIDCLAGCPDETPARITVELLVGTQIVTEADYATTIASHPRFTRERSRLTLARDPLDGGLTIVASILNEGTTNARNVRLVLGGHAAFDGISGPCETLLGDIGAGESRTLTIAVRVPVLRDGASVPLGATIDADNVAPVALEPIAFVTHGFAAIDATTWISPSAEGQYLVTLTNTGTDTARDVELTISDCENVTTTPSIIRIGELHAGAHHNGYVTIDDRRAPGTRDGAAITGIVRMDGGIVRRLDPFMLDRSAKRTFAEAALAVECEEAIAGEAIAYTASIVLAGTLPADRIAFRLGALHGARYVPGSTAINGHRVIDGPGESGGLDRAIVLRNISVARIDLAFLLQLDPALADGTRFSPLLHLVLGDDECTLEAEPTTVHAKAAIPVAPDGLGFALDGIAVGLPREVRESVANLAPVLDPIVERTPLVERSIFAEIEALPADVVRVVTSYEQMERATIIRYLRAAAVPGFIRHVLALRVLVADEIPGASLALVDALTHELAARKAVLDRLLIKLRLPGFAIEATDLEDRASRTALTALVLETVAATPMPVDSDGIFAQAFVERSAMRDSLDTFVGAPLGSTAAFAVLAGLIGTDVPGDVLLTRALRTYRDGLIAALAVDADAATLPAAPELDRALDAIVTALESTREEAA
jgi:hypothetical protein